MMSEQRFRYEYSENSVMIRIIDTEKEEPNGWGMCNVAYTVKKLNDQQTTIEGLEEKINKLINLILSNDVGGEMNLDGEFETYYHIPSSELKKVIDDE